MAIIEACGLTKVFPARTGPIEAVRDITFSLDAGERLAYIGPNGAGKSTSIKMLTGILTPTGGTATVLGLVPWRQRRQLAQHIGVLFGQRSQLWHELNARQSLRLLAAIYELEPGHVSKRIGEVAELFDAADLLDSPVRTLSLGQRMRCELAASVLHRPELLFLDEPTIGLDLVAKQRFRELLVRLSDEAGTTILLTSHDVADIEAVARRVIVINSGTVVRDDDVPTLRRSLLATKLVDVRFERPVETLPLDDVRAEAQTDTVWQLTVDTSRRSIRSVLDHLLEQHAVADISIVDPPLEDVIASIYSTSNTRQDDRTPGDVAAPPASES